MLPQGLLKDRFWLQLGVLLLIIEWSMPVVAQGLYAESHEIFAIFFALAWSLLMATCGLLLYRSARENASLASLAIVLAFATLVLLYRVPACFVQPQIKVEDASVFFIQQREIGLSSFLMAYDGYYHTVVRIFALLIAPVPTLFVPAFYGLAWLSVFYFVTIYVFFQYPDKKWAPLIALTPALVSHTGEVFMSITYAPAIGGLALTAILLLPIPQLKGWRHYLMAGFLVILSLSGPTGLVLLPFYFLRWIWDRKNLPWLYVLAILAGSLVQIPALHAWYAVSKDPSLTLDFDTIMLCLRIAVLRIPWSLAVGYQPFEPYWYIGLVMTILLLAFIAWEIKGNIRQHTFAWCCLVLSAAFFAASILRIYPPEAVVPLVNGDRYFYTSKILLVWALIALASRAKNNGIFFVALVFCVLGSIVEFTSSEETVDYHWPHYAYLIDEGKPVMVPINPPSWGSVLVNGHNKALTP